MWGKCNRTKYSNNQGERGWGMLMTFIEIKMTDLNTLSSLQI